MQHFCMQEPFAYRAKDINTLHEGIAPNNKAKLTENKCSTESSTSVHVTVPA